MMAESSRPLASPNRRSALVRVFRELAQGARDRDLWPWVVGPYQVIAVVNLLAAANLLGLLPSVVVPATVPLLALPLLASMLVRSRALSAELNKALQRKPSRLPMWLQRSVFAWCAFNPHLGPVRLPLRGLLNLPKAKTSAVSYLLADLLNRWPDDDQTHRQQLIVGTADVHGISVLAQLTLRDLAPQHPASEDWTGRQTIIDLVGVEACQVFEMLCEQHDVFLYDDLLPLLQVATTSLAPPD